VDLDAVEAGLQRILRGALEVVDDAWNFGKLERAGLGDVGEGATDKGLWIITLELALEEPLELSITRG